MFFIFKIIGIKLSSYLGGKIFQFIGPFFRSRKLIETNIKRAFPEIDQKKKNKIINKMWNNYGRVFAEYIFMKEIRKKQLSKNITIEGKEILENIKKIMRELFLFQDILVILS